MRYNYSFSLLKWKWKKIRETFEELAAILMFLSPLPHVLLTFTIQMCCSMILTNLCNHQVWNKVLNIKPCIGKISGTLEFLILCEYGRKSMIIGENILTSKNWQSYENFSLKVEGWQFSLKPGENVVHFPWFGEPWDHCTKLWKLDI